MKKLRAVGITLLIYGWMVLLGAVAIYIVSNPVLPGNDWIGGALLVAFLCCAAGSMCIVDWYGDSKWWRSKEKLDEEYSNYNGAVEAWQAKIEAVQQLVMEYTGIGRHKIEQREIEIRDERQNRSNR